MRLYGMMAFHGNDIKRLYRKVRILFIISIIFFFLNYSFLEWGRLVNAQGLNGSIEYTWEKRQIKGKEATKFTQVYDMVLSRQLPRLYDTSIKLEFRSEAIEGEEKRKTQLLPVFNLNFGNPMMNLGLGWSKDNIEVEEGSYTNERLYSTFKLHPKRLPNILFQYWSEERDRSVHRDIHEREYNLAFMEDYSIQIGNLKIIHSYRSKRKDLESDITTTYDLSNKARIGHRFSFFNDTCDIGTKYEFNHGQNKLEDGKKNTILGHNGNINFSTRPYSWMSTYYKFLFGLVEEKEPDNRETSLGHNLSFLFSPRSFLSFEVGGLHNRYTETLKDSARERTTYSFKLIPDIVGLFVDPNRYFIYPINSYLLISRSSEQDIGNIRERTWSFLLNGSTTLYKGCDLVTEIGSSKTKQNITNLKKQETWFDTFVNLRLKPGLTGSVRQRNRWKRHIGRQGNTFEGEIETKLIYRPLQTFLMSLGGTIDYGIEKSSYDATIGWRPENRKTEINIQYHSGDKDEKEYFLGQLNHNISDAIHLRFQYQHPSDDQRLMVQFTMSF